MADYDRREVTTRRVEYTVPTEQPWGANWVELMKAIHAATAELRELGLCPADREPADDQLRLFSRDDEIVVQFEVTHGEKS